MDHTYLEEHQILERYVQGKLPPDELARFEEHYLSCPECLERLDLAERMQRGFKRAAGQDAVRLAAAGQLAIVAWLARLGRSRQAGILMMALLVLLVLPGGLAVRRLGELGRELEETRATLEQERERPARGTHEATEVPDLRTELEESRRALAAEREARTRLETDLSPALLPQGNVPIFFLSPERGETPSEEGPTHRLRLPAEARPVFFALEVDPPHHPTYRAALRHSGGREMWRGADLRLNDLDSLSLSVPSRLLAPGDYEIAVEGLPPGRPPVAVARFPFRVLPSR